MKSIIMLPVIFLFFSFSLSAQILSDSKNSIIINGLVSNPDTSKEAMELRFEGAEKKFNQAYEAWIKTPNENTEAEMRFYQLKCSSLYSTYSAVATKPKQKSK